MNHKVSIIIAIYNEEKYIDACIKSLLQQNYKPIEIIIIDDGSVDKTKTIVTKYPSIHLFSQEHLGTARARNYGAEKATGSILIFVDADMKFQGNFIENLIRPIEDGTTKGTFSKLEYVANWDKPLSRCWNRNNKPILPEKMRVRQDINEGDDFRAILKSEFLRVNGFDNIGYTDTWSLAKKLGHKPVNAPGAVYYHYNPETYSEVFSSAKWIGKREYKFGRIGNIINIVRNIFLFSFLRGIYKSIRYREWQFIPFQFVYDFGLCIGSLNKIFNASVIK